MTRAQTNRQTGNISTPGEAQKLCTRLIEVTADLISVLDRETLMVRDASSEDFTVLAARKQALSVTLMNDMKMLRSNADYIKRAVPGQVQILQEQQDRFHKSLEINHGALTAMKAVSEGLLKTIATKAGQKKTGPGAYTEDAGFDRRGEKPAGPVSVDARL